MKYGVNVPICGRAYIEVEADNEEEAIEEACESIEDSNIEEWEALEFVCKGNVCYAPYWNAEAEVLDSEDEE